MVSEQETFWYHCGRCGSLYQSEVDFSEERVCPQCGQHPASGVADGAIPLQSAGSGEVEQVTLSKPGVVRGRRPRKSHVFLKLFVIWIVLTGLIVSLIMMLTRDDIPAATAVESADREIVAPPPLDDGKQDLLEAFAADCRKVLGNFLTAEGVEARLPWVLPVDGVGERMVQYNESNEVLVANPRTLKLTASTLLELPEGTTVLTQWETKQGASFDAAFRLHDGELKLDWDHFVRYSQQSWPLYVAGSGPDEVEFRLLARRRMTSEEDAPRSIGVVLYAPMRRYLEQLGYQASMQALSLKSRDGQLLQKAFEAAENDEPLFGAAFRDKNPQGMIRVRVLVKRIAGDGPYKFKISGVRACHWYSSSAWGVRLEGETEQDPSVREASGEGAEGF